MKPPTTARHATLALLGVFVALLVAVHGLPGAPTGVTVVPPSITSRLASP